MRIESLQIRVMYGSNCSQGMGFYQREINRDLIILFIEGML